MKMSKLSNQTNSQDPQAVNSRVFVGNLNTFQCSKTDVERMFQRYGRLAGISMHKGYAFVQFTNPFDARNACHGEDGRTILSQVLDVNMVAEPKPHQIGRKRQNVTKTGNDWDYYYDSYYASTLFPGSTPPRPLKRQRLMTPQNRVSGNSANNNKMNAVQQQHQAAAAAMAAMAASAAAAQAVQANMLPTQQQIALHQQSLLQNGTNVNNLVSSCNSSTTNPHGLTTSGKLTGIGTGGGGLIVQQHQQQQQQQQHQTLPVTATTTTSSAATNNHTTLTNCEQMSFVCTNGQLQLLNQQHQNQPQQVQSQQHQQQQQQQQQHQQQQHQQQQQQQLLGPFKVYSNPDTLICGNCRECFSDLGELLDHKRTYCKLRFTCKCQDPLLVSKNPLPTTKLLCAVCKDAFTNPWDLMVHAQAAHMVNIYELGNEANTGCNGTTDGNEESTSDPRNELDSTSNSNTSNNINGNISNRSSSSISSMRENGSINGNASDTEHTTSSFEMNGDVGSPNGSILKEDGHRDDTSFDGRMSSTSPPPRSDVDQQDIIKLNGSVSSRGSSPALENESTPRACIVRAVSIEATSSTPPPETIGIMNSRLAISLANEATVTQ